MAQFFSIQDIGAIGPELYLAMFGMILLVLDLVVENKRTLGLVALIGLAFSGLFLLRLRGVEFSAYGGSLVIDHFSAFFRSPHGTTLQHQLGRAAWIASKEGRKIPPGFLPIGVDMAKDNTPGFDLIIFSAIGHGTCGNFRLPLGKFLRRDKRGKPAVRQPRHPPQGGIAAATYPDIDFFCRSRGNGDMLELVICAMVTDVRCSPELA